MKTTVIHEPSCNRGDASCTCLMYTLNEHDAWLGVFTLSPSEYQDLTANDSLGG